MIVMKTEMINGFNVKTLNCAGISMMVATTHENLVEICQHAKRRNL